MPSIRFVLFEWKPPEISRLNALAPCPNIFIIFHWKISPNILQRLSNCEIITRVNFMAERLTFSSILAARISEFLQIFTSKMQTLHSNKILWWTIWKYLPTSGAFEMKIAIYSMNLRFYVLQGNLELREAVNDRIHFQRVGVRRVPIHFAFQV